MSEPMLIEPQPRLEDHTNLILYRQLGAIEAGLRQLGRNFDDHRADAKGRWTRGDVERLEDTQRFQRIENDMRHSKETLDRIKGPIETYLSLRKVLIGLATIAGGVGALWGIMSGGFATVTTSILNMFHPTQ